MIDIKLSAGYAARPAAMTDLEIVVDFLNLTSIGFFGKEEFSVEEYRREWGTPGFELSTDSLLIISPSGDIVGYQEVWDIFKPSIRVNIWGRVHPEHEDIGIGTYLIAWAEQRARQAVERAPEGARVSVRSYVPYVNKKGPFQHREAGFVAARFSLRMVIELNGHPPRPHFPDDVTVRTMHTGEEHDVIYAVRDSFQDHFGYVDMPFEEEFKLWKHVMENDPYYDPTLWFLAEAGSEIVGMSLCWPRTSEDEKMGWVDTLGVRRPWRRRGIALALLHHSFDELYQRGARRVGLGVDGMSLTGATRLYEKAGMHSDPMHRYEMYEKELRPGVELSTTTLDKKDDPESPLA